MHDLQAIDAASSTPGPGATLEHHDHRRARRRLPPKEFGEMAPESDLESVRVVLPPVNVLDAVTNLLPQWRSVPRR